MGKIMYKGEEFQGNINRMDPEPEIEFYANDLLVAKPGGQYIYGDLDKNLDPGTLYVVSIFDEDRNDATTLSIFWDGFFDYITFDMTGTSGGRYTLRMYEDKVGVTYYAGAYRNIYCKISKAILYPGQEYRPVVTS